jgi:LysR family hydrogen peroxide-inducible transcriptional activator
MVNLPSLRQLQYLVALHKHRHFSKAAIDCCISQSTLSAAISQLEEVLQCQLLERSHKSFIFTTLGEEVVKDAKQLIHAGVDLLNYTRSQSQPMAGQLVLGCIPTIAPFVLGQISKATAQKYPQLQLMLFEQTSETLLNSLQSGEVDLAIVALPYKLDGLYETIMAEDQFNLVMHREVAEKYSTNQIKKLPAQSIFMLNDAHCLSTHCRSLCKLTDKRQIHPFSATSLQTLVQMVDTHKGITFLPQMSINSQILQGTDLISRRAEPEGVHRKIALVWRKSNKRIDTFANLTMIISEIVRAKCLR